MIDLKMKTITEYGFCEIHEEFENVGIEVSGKIVWMGCPYCVQERIANENRHLSMKAEQIRNKRDLASAALPKRYQGKGLDSYIIDHSGHENAIDEAAKYVSEWSNKLADGAGMLLYGNSGTGKTHLAVGIAKEILYIGSSVRYTKASSIIRDVKNTWNKKSKMNESEVYESYADVDLLIIDEIGRQYGSDTERMILFEVINSRYEQNKPIIAITNLGGLKLKEYLGDAAFDRLKEKGSSVCFDWASMRARM